MLWEVNLTVERKRLSDVLEAVEGKVVDWSMRAVKGAQTAKTKVTETEPVGGSMADKVAYMLKASGMTALSREQLSKLIVEIGGNPSGISYYVANLRNTKIIGKFNKETGTYALLKRK